MSLDAKGAAALALHRFGLGPRAGSIAAIASDPRGALLAELDKPGIGQIVNPELLSAAQANRAVFNFRQERQARLIAQRKDEEERKEAGMSMESMEGQANAAQIPAAEAVPQQNFQREVKARFDAAIAPEIGFVERLVWFWSNHFCVSADVTISLTGGYEREAIRTHVLGRFADMLLASAGHPAMLFYLDNSRSIGPKSVAGLVNNTGLNENLAREILELHTLGVRSVYTQADVTSFAKVLTGWTIRPLATDPERGGEFVFNPRLHEPGPQTVVGKVYAQPGVEQGRAVLADIARHPATAAHVARKLARHFCSDEPPDSLTERLAKRFLDTDGDLKEIAKALVELPETWDEQRIKLKRPTEWLMSIMARHRRRAGCDARPAGDGLSWRAHVAPARTDRFFGCAVGVDRRSRTAARYREPHRRAGAGAHRAGRVHRRRARLPRNGGDAQDHCARREPPAGADARDDGAGIPKAVMT